MARILHVEDEVRWLELVRDRLSDHHVDSARSHREALNYLQGNASYDLALVDLKLDPEGDLGGGEVLDLLRKVYPETRRVVITGRPPAGSMRATVFERFDVEEIIIKSQTDAPDLRLVVEEALSRRPGGLSQEQRLRRSELRQRFRDWRREITKDLRERVRIAEEHVSDAKRVSGQSKDRAELNLNRANARMVAFGEACNQLRQMLDLIKGANDLADVADALDAAEEQFGQDFDGNASDV